MINRRSFLQRMGWATVLTAAHQLPLRALATDAHFVKLTILHTNDVHSRLEPFPMDGGKWQGMGGVARRAAMIQQIRAEGNPVLLLDAGDMFQGTPYFNFFGGEPEIKAMSLMGYDAGTLGNHDFDGGISGLVKQLPHATFPLLNCNYSMKDTALHGKIKPYTIIEKRGLKIGITGVTVDLDGLVPAANWLYMQYKNPIAPATEIAKSLKLEHQCDYVICLSHLGYELEANTKVCDTMLARESAYIDMIIGGHSHTFMEKPATLLNKMGQPVVIHQVGWGGILLGRIDLLFERNRTGYCTTCEALPVR